LNSFPGKNFHGMGSEMFSKQPILFYDGDCPLCNRVVTFILNHEKDSKILFSALDTAAANEFLSKQPSYKREEDTVYFFDGNQLYSKSTAVLKLLTFLKGYLLVLRLGWLFPRGLRDSVYDFVAKRRQRIVKECIVDVRLSKRLLQP
jgi:predicted DCC family thiol-disulfide oxidoreductase YuxK